MAVEEALSRLEVIANSETVKLKRERFGIVANKKAGNEIFEQFLPVIEREAIDDRIYVKKAVNWALRNIGKRNQDLRGSAIATARFKTILGAYIGSKTR